MKLLEVPLAKQAWYFDYDGSLCPHQEVWEERTYNPEEIYSAVEGLAARGARIVWNTGRRPESLGSVDARFLNYTGYFVHGSVRWDPPNRATLIGPALPAGLAEAAARACEPHADLKLEVKPTSLRITPVNEHELDRLFSRLSSFLQTTPEGWAWARGRRGIELLALGHDKSSAVREDARREGAGFIPIAVGDDVFDRPAFEEAFAAGGYAIAVGSGVGWVTELHHNPDQLIFCESPLRVLELLADLIR